MATRNARGADAKPGPTAGRDRSGASGLLGLVVMLGAAAVMAGWAGRHAAIVFAAPGVAMVFSSALCFALVGLALAGARFLPQRFGSLLQALLGGVVALIATLALLQRLAGWGLGIDWPELHRWAAADEPHPGRMSALTAGAMLMVGALLLLANRAKDFRLGIVVQALTVLVIAVGVLGFAGWALRLNLVYENFLFGRISLLSALGFVVVGVALWLAWRRMPWYRSRALIADEGLRISLTAIAILALTLTLTLAATFGIIERQLEAVSRKHLVDPLKRRVDQFRLVVDLRTARASMLLSGFAPAVMQRALGAQPGDEAARAQFRAVAEGFLQHGFSGIALLDASGRTRADAGRFTTRPELEAPLAGRPVALLWDEGFVLRSRLPLRQGEAVVGTVLAEQRLHELTTLLEYAFDFAASGDVIVCAREPGGSKCFPHRAQPKSYDLPQAAALPAARAIAGESGIVPLRDRGGANLVSAFGPIGNLGLGMLVTMRTAEIYAPLRDELHRVALLLIGMAALGALLLYWRIAPLARRLVLQEQRLQLALDNSKSAVWDLDFASGQVYLSEQWPVLLGGRREACSTSLKDLGQLVHPDDMAQVRRKLRATLRSEDLPYDVEHRVRTPDGEWTWIHSVGKVVRRDGRGRALRMIGVNTNIARRKQEQSFIERRASRDEATGLPNRSVFSDRLQTAMARSRRAPPDRSLMAVLVIGIHGAPETGAAGVPGQELLKAATQRMQRCVRATDSIARLGIDEFAVILEELGLTEQARGIAGKIIEALQERIAIDDAGVSLSTAIGIAFYDGVIKVTGEQLVSNAQHAMYDARNAAPNSCRVAAH